MKRFVFLIISIGILIIMLSHPSRANENGKGDATDVRKETMSAKIFQLDEVIVKAEEIERDIETPNMNVIKPELFPMGIGTTVDTALERQPGVDVGRIQQVGTAIDDDSIKIRGFGARRILVTRNGRPLNTSGVAGGYFIDWTMIHLNNIDRIEVIKGIADPKYGNVLGGIVNLVNRELPEDAPVTEAQVSTGSYNTNSLNVFHGWKPSAFGYSLALGFFNSDGYLKNGNLNSGNIDLHLGYDFSSKNKLKADISYSKIKKGFIVSNRKSKDYDDKNYNVPEDPDYPASDGEYMYGGMGANPEPGSWWEKKRWIFDTVYEHTFRDNSTISLRYWQNQGDREAYNPRIISGKDKRFHKNFYDDRSYGASGSYKYVRSSHTLQTGFDFSHLRDDGDERLFMDSKFDEIDFAGERNKYYVASKNIGAFLMDDITIGDNLALTPGLRYMSYDGISGPSGDKEGVPDITMDGLAPSLKLTYYNESGTLLYLSGAKALRMPTPPEHYWHYVIYEDENKDYIDDDPLREKMRHLPFKEEDGLLVQGGWKKELSSSTKIELLPFYYYIENYIQFDLINFISYNIARTRLYGLELEFIRQIGSGWSMFFNYTFQKSKTEGDPFIENLVDESDRSFNEIPGLPQHKGNFGLQYKGARNEKIALFIKAVSDQDVIYNNNSLNFDLLKESNLRLRKQAGYATIDIEGHYPILDNVELAFFGRNIFDRVYQERFGFPASGRTFGFSLKAGF